MKSLIFLVALTAVAHAQSGAVEGTKIVEIEVTGNTKTNDETVLLIARVDTGDRFTYDTTRQVEEDLVSSGLFKDVKVYAQSVEKGTKLTIEARDKHSWIIAPTVYLQPGNKGAGVGFGENNLGGANKKLLLYLQIATADSLFIAGYLDPSLVGSRHFYWRAYTFNRREDVTEYSSPNELFVAPVPEKTTTMWYLNAAVLLGINLWKGFALDTQIRGARVWFEDPACDTTMFGCTAVAPDKEGWDVSLEWKITRDKRANWYGITSGNMQRIAFEKGMPDLGSDWDYWIAGASWVWAKRIFEEWNFIWKSYVGLGDDLPFHTEFTSGGTNLRGYRNRQYRGDFKASNTIELSVPFFKIGPVAFRGLTFWDTAYTGFVNNDAMSSRVYLDGQTDEEVSRWRNGVGAGFRIYLKSIVLPLLGLDWGYGIETGEWHMYFAVGLTEL